MGRGRLWLLRVIVAFGSLVLGIAQTPPSMPGSSVQGVVLDEAGKPISRAHVYAVPDRDFRNPIQVTANADGEFVLSNLPTGDIYVHAYDESKGYADNFFAFFRTGNDRAWRRVTLTAGTSITGVVIQLGPKAAYLNFEVFNEQHEPVNASVEFNRDDMGVAGRYRRSLPSNEAVMVPPIPFRVTVTAEGYEPWHYGGANYADKAGLITLKSGQTLTLNVRLRKK